MCDNSSCIIQNNENNNYQYLLREVYVEYNNQLQRGSALKIYNVYGGEC